MLFELLITLGTFLLKMGLALFMLGRALGRALGKALGSGPWEVSPGK